MKKEKIKMTIDKILYHFSINLNVREVGKMLRLKK